MCCRVRPDAEMTYDGVSVTPYEVVFVPVSTGSILNNWTFVEQAVQYQRYLEQQVRNMACPRIGQHGTGFSQAALPCARPQAL